MTARPPAGTRCALSMSTQARLPTGRRFRSYRADVSGGRQQPGRSLASRPATFRGDRSDRGFRRVHPHRDPGDRARDCPAHGSTRRTGRRRDAAAADLVDRQRVLAGGPAGDDESRSPRPAGRRCRHGVVVGVAAQQVLGNFFAGLVLLFARPYTPGEYIVVHSGALGGPFEGTIVEAGLIFTTLLTAEGPLRLPNAGLLGAATGPASKQSPGPDTVAE